MAYSFQEIVTMSQTKTGREIAAILGVRQPADSYITEERYMNNEGGRIIRAAREQVESGNGHGFYGEKRRKNGGGNGKAVDPLATIQDIEVVMAARLAAKKAGIDETGEGIRDAIESRHKKVIAFLDFALSAEQRKVLENAVGVLTPEQREAKRREDLIAAIRTAVLKAVRLDSMRRELETYGFVVEAPLWFDDVGKIDLDLLPTKTTTDLKKVAASMPTA